MPIRKLSAPTLALVGLTLVLAATAAQAAVYTRVVEFTTAEFGTISVAAGSGQAEITTGPTVYVFFGQIPNVTSGSAMGSITTPTSGSSRAITLIPSAAQAGTIIISTMTTGVAGLAVENNYWEHKLFPSGLMYWGHGHIDLGVSSTGTGTASVMTPSGSTMTSPVTLMGGDWSVTSNNLTASGYGTISMVTPLSINVAGGLGTLSGTAKQILTIAPGAQTPALGGLGIVLLSASLVTAAAVVARSRRRI